MTSLELAEKSVPILDLDIPKMKELANQEFTSEKESYLKVLKKRQEQLKNNATQRIFAMVGGQYGATKAKEDQFI